jgi:hypothetical protein
MLEMIKQNIDSLENNLVFKSSYDEEIQKLDGYKSDLSTLRYSASGIYLIKINEQIERINHIEQWIKEEMKRYN